MNLLLRYLGYVLIISSVFRIIPIVAALVYGEPIFFFILSAFVSILLGFLLLWTANRKKKEENVLSFKQALILITLSFVLLSLIGSISFLESFNNNILDAIFESVSGITTTGLSVYSTVAEVPKSVLLWRAEMQWMGGLGIVMFFLFLLSMKKTLHRTVAEAEELALSKATLYRAQGFSKATRLGVRISSAIKIYFVYTFLGILLLYFTGMPIYDSVAMTFTSVSTGGFSVSDGFYTNNLQLLVLSLLMLAGATSFIAHDKLFRGKIKDFLRHPERNILFIFIGVAFLITLISSTNVKVVLFEIVSAYTTTGYTLTNVASLPQLFIMVIMVGMVIGGCTLSTAGGMKAFRFYIILRTPFWFLRKMASPIGAIVPFKFRNEPLTEKTLLTIQIFFSTWILLLLSGTIILTLLGNNLFDASFQMTSALGTVGLSTMNLSTLHWLGKIILMLGMLLGRLELFPLLFLVRNVFKRS